MKTRKLSESYSEQSAGRLTVLPVQLGGNSTIETVSQSKAERASQLCSPGACYCHRPGRNEDPLNRQITPLFDTLFDTLFDGLFKQWATRERNFPRNLIPGKESQQGTCLSEGGVQQLQQLAPSPRSLKAQPQLTRWLNGGRDHTLASR